jgi:hypothetical protein
MVPGFPDPAVASHTITPSLYFGVDSAVIARSPGENILGGKGPSYGQQLDLHAPTLMFGHGQATTGSGEPIVNAAVASSGHWSEITNFHGSPAPWILIGILLVAGILHLSAKGSASVGGAL